MSQVLLALDFGGTKLSAATIMDWEEASDRPTRWEGLLRTKSPQNSNVESDLRIMTGMAKSLLNGEKPLAIGVSFGGPTDRVSNVVRLSHHVPGWENYPLGAFLHDTLAAPVQIDNDANAAALGEHRFGAGDRKNSLLYITISTGVGGGWVINGQLWAGASGMAGEIGHTVIDPNGPLCLCGKKGCLERFASGPYLEMDMRQYLSNHPTYSGPIQNLVQDHLDTITAETISTAARMGDGLAQKYLLRAAWAVGVAIGNTANLVNPDIFVLGGGVTKSGKIFWDKIEETAREVALPQTMFEIKSAQLGDDSPLWGAAFMARELAHHQ